MDIFWFTRHGEYGFLSNFYHAPLDIDGRVWPTAEHYYQAMKSADQSEQEMIRGLATPKEAKFAGSHLALRENWEGMKEWVMLRALRAKFSQHADLGRMLLATGEAILHEDSPWDTYWGHAKGKGLCRLGALLMQVREELKEQADPEVQLGV